MELTNLWISCVMLSYQYKPESEECFQELKQRGVKPDEIKKDVMSVFFFCFFLDELKLIILE